MDLSLYRAEADNVLLRIDGRVKTVALLAAIVQAATLANWKLALLVWIVATGLFCSLRLNARILLARLLMPLGIAWLVFVSVLFTHGDHPLFVVPIGRIALTAWREGAMQGVLLFVRIMAAVTLAALLAFSTPMIEILETLRWCKVPGTVIDIADMMYRYVFVIQDTAHAMRCAQLSRLGDSGSWTHRITDAGHIACSVLIKSVDRSARIYQAMLARGHSEDTTEIRFFTQPIPMRDKLLAGASGLAMAALAVANVRCN